MCQGIGSRQQNQLPTPAKPKPTRDRTRKCHEWFGSGTTNVRWRKHCYLETIAILLISNLFTHAYLPTTKISDEASAFKSQVIAVVANNLGITLIYDTTKHALTIGRLEWTHASGKRAPKIENSERRSFDTSFSTMQIWTSTRSTRQVLGVNLSEFSTDAFRKVSSIWR